MSALESLRRAIRQQTEAIGQPVTNLIGPVARLGLPLQVITDSAWLLLRLPGTKLLTPDEYYSRYSTLSERRVEEIPAKDGLVIVIAANPQVFLLRGVADVIGTITAPIEIATSSGEGEWAIYVNGNLARKGSGSKEFSLSLTEGRVLFEVIVVSSSFALQFPPGLRIQPLKDVLTAPIWHSVETDYVDPKSGTAAVHLKWYNNPRVGGWSILRRELDPLAPIIQLGLPNTSGEFGIAIPDPDGSLVERIALGSALYAGFEHIGQALDVDHNGGSTITFEGTPYTGITSMKVQLPAERLDANPFWLGRTLGTGVFRELTRVQRSGLDQLVPYDDMAVIYGAPYEYALQAYGLFDPTALSPLSEIRYVRAGDTVPPGPIKVLPSYPLQINGLISLRYDTPADEDYAGVRTYFRYVSQTGNVAGATSTAITLPAPVVFDPKGYIVQINSGPCAGQVRRIKELQAGSTATLVLEDGDSWFQETPTPSSTFEFYKFLEVKVAGGGLPNTVDWFDFDAIPDPGDATKKLKGLYYFPTFDLAGNVQDLFGTDVYVFDYDPDKDTTVDRNQPPVVGMRQIRPIEQANNYVEPFNDTKNYAILELTARDPVDELDGVIIEYRGRKISFGTISSTSQQTVTDGTQNWSVDEHQNYLLQVYANDTSAATAPMALAMVLNTSIPLSIRRFDGGSGSVLVSNGIPLRRGLLLPKDLPNVVIKIGGVAKPAYVEALPGTYNDGTLRAILVQFTHTFSTPITGALVLGTPRVDTTTKTVISQGKPAAVALPSDTSYLNQAAEAFLFQKTVAQGTVGVGTGALPFGVFNLTDATDARWNAFVREVTPANVLTVLAAAQANGKKVILDLAQSSTAANTDGTFDQVLWQNRIDAYNAIDLSTYITNGTLLGHFLVDTPHAAATHGGLAIPHAVTDALAAYSKTKWPTLQTYVRMPPSRMLGFDWLSLDNAWAQYGQFQGDINLFATTQTQNAQSLGLGLMWGLNVLGGGAAGVMTPEEIRRYGQVIATQTYSKGLIIWSGAPATDWTALNSTQQPAIAEIRLMQESVATGTTAHTGAESRILDYEARHWWCFYNNNTSTTCSGLTGAQRALQYNKGERARTCFKLWCQTGDVTWYDRAFTYLEAYRTQYWTGLNAPPEDMIPEGIMAAYWLSGYEGWKTGLLTNYKRTYATLPPEQLRLPGFTSPANDGRTLAQALWCCFFGAITGDTTVVPRLDGRSWAQLANVHFAIPIETQLSDGSFNWRVGIDSDWGLNDPTALGTSNYQLAQLAVAMIATHEHYRPDSRLADFMRKTLTYLEGQYRSTTKDWRYQSGRTLLPGATGNWDLNAVIAAPYAWFASTGETTWRARAEEALNEANTLANVGNNAGVDGGGHTLASTFRLNSAYYSYGAVRTTTWIGAGISPVMLAFASAAATAGVGVFAAGAIASNTASTLTLQEPFEVRPADGSDFEISWVTNIPASATGTALDDPRGTRSRYVAIAKTENSNHFQVRAHDKDGLYSDILSYTPDFDSIPEITDVSSRLDTVFDHMYLTGSVDDDCGSFEWWLEGALDAEDPRDDARNKTTGDDTSQQKAFAIDFPLFDGKLKKLFIRPYSLPHQQGITGPDFVREFARSPRTLLHWEDKALINGQLQTSATTGMMSFEVTPPINVVWGPLDDAGGFTEFIESVNKADKKIVDEDAGWIPGQFRPDATTYTEFYVRVQKPGGFEGFAPIADNTATELTLAKWFDTTWWAGQDPQADWPIQVRDGLTYYRFGPQPFKDSFEGGDFIGTFDVDFVSRIKDGDLHVQYFTKMSGVPAEHFNNFIADADSLPEFATLDVASGPGVISVTIDGWDDDTKSWICFGRKGRSPTKEMNDKEGLDGPQAAALEPQYIKYNGLLTTATSFEFSAGDGHWFVTACPINSKGEYGPCRTKTIDVTGGGPIEGEAAKLTRFMGKQADVPPIEATDAYNIIIYEHNTLADFDHQNVTMKIYAERDDKPGTELEITSFKFDGTLQMTGPDGTERRPWQDSMRGNNDEILFTQERQLDANEGGSSTSGIPYTLQGSFLHLTGDKRGLEGPASVQRTWNYRAVVYEDGLVVQEVPAFGILGWFQSSAIVPGFIGEPTAAIINNGACAARSDGVFVPSPGIQIRVQWQLDPAKVNGDDYFIALGLARDAGGTEFNDIENLSAGVPAGDKTFIDDQFVTFASFPLNNYLLTDNLQFPEHRIELGTTNVSDGYGYQNLRLPGSHPVLTSVLADGNPLLKATITPGIIDGKAAFGAATPIGPSNGNAVFMLEGHPLILTSADPAPVHQVQLADYPLTVTNTSRGIDIPLYVGQAGPAFSIVLNSIQILPLRGTLQEDFIHIQYSYRDGDPSNGTRLHHWAVIDSVDGWLRVWNEVATTTGQDIAVNGTCDSAVEGAQIRYWKFRVRIARKGSNEVIADAFTNQVSANAGTCARRPVA